MKAAALMNSVSGAPKTRAHGKGLICSMELDRVSPAPVAHGRLAAALLAAFALTAADTCHGGVPTPGHPPRSGAGASRTLAGEGLLIDYNTDGRVARRSRVICGGSFSSNAYSLWVRYGGSMTMRTSHERKYTYIIAEDAGSTNGVRPALIGEGYYPLDGDFFTRVLVVFCDWYVHPDGAARVRYDPFLGPRTQAAFEATTQRVLTASRVCFSAQYVVEPSRVRRLLGNWKRPRFLPFWLKRSDREVWSRGYADARGTFTNSLWVITNDYPSHYALTGEMRRGPAIKSIAGRRFETARLELRVASSGGAPPRAPDVTRMQLSVYDHRFECRDKYVDGIHYTQTNEPWLPMDDPRLLALFAREKAVAPLRVAELRRSPRYALVIMIFLVFAAALVWLGVRLGSRKTIREPVKEPRR